MTAAGHCNVAKVSIELMYDEPITCRPYPIPYAEREHIDRQIDDLLRADIIFPSTSQYASTMLIVKKAEGSPRLCVEVEFVS